MSGSVNFNPQSGGVLFTGNDAPAPIPLVPKDKQVNFIPDPITFTVQAGGQPVLSSEGLVSLIDFFNSIQSAIQGHKESSQNDFTIEAGISAKLYANYVTQADEIVSRLAELIAQARSWISRVQAVQDDVATAYSDFSNAIATYNNGIASIKANDASQILSVNANIAYLNSYQGLSQSDYDNLIAANGGESAVSNSINQGFTNWNNYVNSRNPQVATLQSNMATAINNWKAAITLGNSKLDVINDERTKQKLPLVGKYPNPTNTFTTAPDGSVFPASAANYPTTYGTLAGISGNVGPGRPQRNPVSTLNPNNFGSVTVVSLSSLALSNIPKMSDITESEIYKQTVRDLLALANSADKLAILFQIIFSPVFDITKKGNKKVKSDSFIDKKEPIPGSTGGSGAGIGVVGRPELDRVVPIALWNAIMEIAKFPISSRAISTFQLASLGLLDKSSIAAAIPAASAFGNKLGAISELSPTFSAVLASSIADNTLATVASNPARELANILLKNLVGAASAAGISFGEGGTPSAGELAQISSSLAAAFNINLLGTTLALFQESLNKPDLSFQVLANVQGVSPSDALRASLGESESNSILKEAIPVQEVSQSLANSIAAQNIFTNTESTAIAENAVKDAISSGNIQDQDALQRYFEEQLLKQGLSSDSASLLAAQVLKEIIDRIGSAGLNQGIKDQLKASKAASDLLDSVLGLNEKLASIFGQAEDVKNRIVENIIADREQVASIIKESILAAIRSGKIDNFRNFLDTNSLQAILDRSGGGVNVEKLLGGLTDIKILNREDLHRELSQHLDNLLTGVGAANAREARDKILIALLGGATPKEVMDVDKRNPVSIVNQIEKQVSIISKNTTDAEREKIHDDFIDVMHTFMQPRSEFAFAISSMQDKPTTVLNSISGAVQAVAQTDILGISQAG